MSRRRHYHRVSLPRLPRLPRRNRRADQLFLHEQRRAIKRAMMRDCSRRCVYCASALELEVATIDHVFPLAKGGVHDPGNLVAACSRCNRLKGDMLPTSFSPAIPGREPTSFNTHAPYIAR